MYIRETITKNKKNNTQYVTHKLVHSFHTDAGSRQRVIMNLGKLELPKNRWPELANALETRINGQMVLVEEDNKISQLADNIIKHEDYRKRIKMQEEVISDQEDYQHVDINSTQVSIQRSLGAEIVANSFWERLDFDNILTSCSFSPKQRSLAKAVILGRLLQPGSEYATWRWFLDRTALIEMTEENLEGIGKDSFYEIGDLLFENKDKIEKQLFDLENNILEKRNKVFLYDLTNTYFEGSAKKNDSAERGKSKEKRSDCPLVTLALMVDDQGFPVFSQIYKGNQGEPATLEDVLGKLSEDSHIYMDENKPVLIMDRGIATKDNIALIRSKCYPYTVIERRQTEKDYEEEFSEIKAWMDSGVEDLIAEWEFADEQGCVAVKKISLEGINHILGVSIGKKIKEQSMDELKEKRFLEDISRLIKSFNKGNVVVPVKVGERIGKIKARYPTVGRYYSIDLKISEDGKRVEEIVLNKKPERKQRSTLTGCYVIETTQTELSAKEAWKQYMTLTRVEGAFQDLKSELGLRPIHHQNTVRTSAHLFIGVLAYHILNLIENNLKTHGDKREWNTIKKILSTHERSTVILRGTEKKVYHLRISGNPESCHKEIYNTLNVKDILKRKKRCEISRFW